MNVLLVRADGVGDALVCAPLVAGLHAAGHAVSAVLGTRNRAIFSPSAFAHVHVLERIAWPGHGSTPESRQRALAQARAARYDVALVASEEMDAFVFARDAEIARRIGFVNGWEKPLKNVRVRALLTHAIARPASATRAREHEVETLFALGSGLVREEAPTRDVARLRALIADTEAVPHGAVAVQVSEKLRAAGLGRDAFVALARTLRATGHVVRVLGDDDGLVRDVAIASDAFGLPGLDVSAWKAQIAGARALLTADSGAAHVAGMLGVPTVDCFAPGPATAHDIRRWSPWAAPYRALVLAPTRTPEACGHELARAASELIGTNGVR